MDLTVESIQNLNVEGAEMLVASVDITGVNPSQAADYMQSVQLFLDEKLDCDVIVIPSTITLTTINGRPIEHGDSTSDK